MIILQIILGYFALLGAVGFILTSKETDTELDDLQTVIGIGFCFVTLAILLK